MTPLGINILLHYHSRVDDYGGESRNWSAPAVVEMIDYFLKHGLLEHKFYEKGTAVVKYKITKMGHEYVEQGLCRVPLPVNEWRIPWENIG
jgi:hypothetical protein